MNLPRDPSDDFDRLMGDNAGDLGALYRRLPRVDPPKRLDRTVLGEAARAVRGRAPRRHGWIVGVGSAAGVVLAAGIAWQIGNSVPHQTSHEGYRSAPSVVPVQPITDSPSRRRETGKEIQETHSNRASDEAAATPVQAATSPQSARKPEPQKSAPSAPRTGPAAASMKAAAPPPAEIAPPPAPFPADAAKKEQDSLDSIQTGPTAKHASANAADGMPLREQEIGQSGVLDRGKDGTARSAGAPSPSGSVELRRDMQLSPEDWLAHIRELARQGRKQQALESLRLLRRMHPDVNIPETLRALEE